MPNYLWFFSLVAISVALFLRILQKKRIEDVLPIYFFISGLAFLFEYIIFVLLKSYQYKPEVFEDLWFDSVLGSSISQSLAVPVAATYVVCFDLKRKWYFVCILIFILIEGLFSMLNIYQLFWWHYLYTSFFLYMAFLLTNRWKKIITNSGTFSRFVTLYLAIITIENTLEFYSVAIFHTHFFSPHWFDHPVRDHIAGNSFYVFIYAIFLSYICSRELKWYSYLIMTFYQIFSLNILKNLDWIKISDFWGIKGFIFFSLGTMFLYRFIYLRMFNSPHTSNESNKNQTRTV